MYLGPYQRPAQLHSATAQQSPQGSSMKGLCAVVGIGTTAVLHSVLTISYQPTLQKLKPLLPGPYLNVYLTQ